MNAKSKRIATAEYVSRIRDKARATIAGKKGGYVTDKWRTRTGIADDKQSFDQFVKGRKEKS